MTYVSWFYTQTSSRRYSIDIHIQRKHPPPQTNNIIQPPIFNESYNIINFENPSYNEITPMIHPSPPFHSPPFVVILNLGDANDKDKKGKRKKFQ